MNFPLDGWQHVASSDDYQTWRKPYPGGDYRWVVVCTGGGETHICPAVYRADVDGGVPFLLYTDPISGAVFWCDADNPDEADEYSGTKPHDLDLAEQDYARARSTPAPAPAAPPAPAPAPAQAQDEADPTPYTAARLRVDAVLHDDALSYPEKCKRLHKLTLEGIKHISAGACTALHDRANFTLTGYHQGYTEGYAAGAAVVRAIYTDDNQETA